MNNSAFLENDIIYYGLKVDHSYLLDNPDRLTNLNQIPIIKLKVIVFNRKKAEVALQYEKDNESIIRFDSLQEMNVFQTSILKHYPKSRTLHSEKTNSHQIKKPLFAIGVIFVLTILISFINPNDYSTLSSGKSNMIIDLLRGFASLGMTKVILIFGSVMLIPIMSIIIKLRNAKYRTIIEIKITPKKQQEN